MDDRISCLRLSLHGDDVQSSSSYFFSFSLLHTTFLEAFQIWWSDLEAISAVLASFNLLKVRHFVCFNVRRSASYGIKKGGF